MAKFSLSAEPAVQRYGTVARLLHWSILGS
jgi:hypothetical protein